MVRTPRMGQAGRHATLPGPVRAALGLVALTARRSRHALPDKAIELPMLAVSTALQVSLRAQQRYAELAARGDEILARRDRRRPAVVGHLRRPTDEPVPDSATRRSTPAPRTSCRRPAAQRRSTRPGTGAVGSTRSTPSTVDDARWPGSRPRPSRPVPVRVVALQIGEWIARLGEVWVDGQIAQLTRRPACRPSSSRCATPTRTSR